MNEFELNEGMLVGVAVEKAHFSFDILFEYSVPFQFENEVEMGKRVIIPFGKGMKKCVGLIMTVRRGEYSPKRIKKIISVYDTDKPVLNHEMIELVKWLKENTFCTYYDAVKTIIPAGLGITLSERFKIGKTCDVSVLSDDEKRIYEVLLNTKSPKETDEMINELIIKNKRIFTSLSEKGAISELHEAKNKFGGQSITMLRLVNPPPDGEQEVINLTPKQKKVIGTLEEYGCASTKEVCYTCSVTPAVVANLRKKGLIEEYENTVSHSLTKDNQAESSPPDIVFSPAQQRVFDGLNSLLNENEAKCALLRGVTGSGKTSVFIKLIERVTAENKTAVMLVPEIALTPQMTGNFVRVFGNKVAIIHSGLSLGQRADEYRRIESGEAPIVIGTRSAVFAPVKNLGIIVIDEEGEHTYKSDCKPRYHARNVAKQRAFYHKALLLLASATPSLDSSYMASIGKYSLFELEERYSNSVLPDVYIVDMKIEAAAGNRSNFSGVLLHELAYNLEKGEQSIVLLNRRGYHTYANCVSCGAVIECPDCCVAMTYHKANETMQCHYCGHTKPKPQKCEKCGSKYIYQAGTGTQRIEDELNRHFPEARILRMDADTTMTKNAYEKKFTQFGNNEFDIMVGTQMIAKGLDFENVTLVGVLLVDKMLYAGDYIGYERVFSLVTQVVGRSGRGGKKGRAFLQTFTPEHYVLELAAAQNYKEFYNQEIEIRKALIFPPFCDLFILCFSSPTEQKAQNAAKTIIDIFMEQVRQSDNSKMPYRILGPTKSSIGRVNGKYRYKVIIKAKNNAAVRRIINETLKTAFSGGEYRNEFANTGFYIDINGEIP